MSQPECLWDRWDDEPIRWFGRFDKYFRPLGPERTSLAAYNRWRKDKGRPPASSPSSAWRRAFLRWEWQRRAEAWDEDERRKRLIEEQDMIAQMHQEHTALARGLLTRASRGLNQLLQQGDQARQLNDTEIRQYINTGILLERQARGLPAWLLEVAMLTDEELVERNAELLALFGGGPGGDADPWPDLPVDGDGDDGEVPPVSEEVQE